MKLQLNQNYTARQRGLIGAFRKSGEATIDEIAVAIELEVGRRTSRGSANQLIHNVASKLAQDGYVILRKSGLGRSQKGMWVLTELNSTQQTGE